MIVFSDLHLCEATANVVIGEVLPGILNAALERGDEQIAFLGDWWHVRHRIPVALQNEVARWLRMVHRSDVSTTILPGNHDQIDEAGEHALEVFYEMPGVTVKKTPSWDRFGLWVPYRKNLEQVLAAVRIPKPEGCGDILFLHHGVQGAMLRAGVTDVDGSDPNEFEKWPLVLSGHYHAHQRVGQVVYVGSPYQVDAGEACQAKGFVVVDARPGCKQFEFVKTNWGKRYHNIVLGKGEALDLSGIRPGDEVRVTSAPGVSVEKVSKQISDAGMVGIVTPEVEQMEARLQVTSEATLRDFARAYVAEKAKGDETAAPKLWEVFEEIVP